MRAPPRVASFSRLDLEEFRVSAETSGRCNPLVPTAPKRAAAMTTRCASTAPGGDAHCTSSKQQCRGNARVALAKAVNGQQRRCHDEGCAVGSPGGPTQCAAQRGQASDAASGWRWPHGAEPDTRFLPLARPLAKHGRRLAGDRRGPRTASIRSRRAPGRPDAVRARGRAGLRAAGRTTAAGPPARTRPTAPSRRRRSAPRR